MASPRKFLVLAKIESTQFTDAAPVAGTDAMLVKNLKVTPLRVESEDRALIRSYLGNSEQLPVLEEAMIEFDIEMAGAGAAGTIPKYGPLLKGCGFAEVNNPGVSTVYSPVSTGFNSLTIWCYRDGVVYKLVGCMGTFAIDGGAKKVPHFKFKFTGKYTAVTDLALATGTFTGWTTPVASIPAKTGTTTIGGYAAKLSDLNFDLAGQISHALWMNGETLQFIDRKPKGSLTVEAVTIATNDYFTSIRNATLSALTWSHGVTAGNIVQVDMPKVQLTDIAETDFQGTLAYTMNITVNPNTGNDEVVFTVK